MTPTGLRFRGSGLPGQAVERATGAVDRVPPPSRPESLSLRMTAFGWLAVWELARLLPEGLAFRLADLGGRLAFRRAAGLRATVTRNLARVVGEPGDDVVREAFRSYARYWVEAFRAADLDPADLEARTTTGGFEHIDGALDRGRGVVVVLAHHGSWDVAARWAETHGYHMGVVAEVLRPRRLFARFVELREAIGLEIVPLRRGAEAGDLLAPLGSVLAGNHLVGLLSERDLSGRGAPVTLFGEPTTIPRGPAVLALRTGAALIPITMLQRPGRRWHLQILPEVDVTGLDVDGATARVAAAIEDIIRLDPVQWHCFSRVWAADRP